MVPQSKVAPDGKKMNYNDIAKFIELYYTHSVGLAIKT